MTMGRGRGRGMLGQRRFSPYGYNPGHYGGYQAAYQPTFPHPGFNPYYNRPRGRPFLGESPFNMSIADRERQIDCQNDNYAHIVQNQYQHVNTNVVSPVHRVEEPRRKVAQEREGEQVEQDDSAVHTDEAVGKCAQSMPKIEVNRWGPTFKAGRVSECVDEWAKITSDRFILNDIRNFKLQFTSPPTQIRPLPELRFSPAEKAFIHSEIASLLEKGVLEKSVHTPGEFISNIFLREKKEKGKYRMILNLKHLNKSVEKINFKMDTLMTTLALVTPGCNFLSFDFSDAYYSCSIFPPHRKYLKFTFGGELFEFTCLPNGLSSAPRFFTKIMKVALSHLRSVFGVTISGYLDDNILINNVDLLDTLQKGTELQSFSSGWDSQ